MIEKCYICGKPATRTRRIPNGEDRPVCKNCGRNEFMAANGKQLSAEDCEMMMKGVKMCTRRRGGKWRRL